MDYSTYLYDDSERERNAIGQARHQAELVLPAAPITSGQDTFTRCHFDVAENKPDQIPYFGASVPLAIDTEIKKPPFAASI